MNAIDPTVASLEQLVQSGAFASRVDQHLNRTFRDLSRPTFYSTALRTEGRAATERELATVVARDHYYAFGSCIESAAYSVVALAQTSPGSLVDVTAVETSVINPPLARLKKMCAFFNMRTSGYCGSALHLDSRVFAPYGDLYLKAVLLSVGENFDGQPAACMSLALPAWGTDSNPPQPGSFVIASITTDGYSTGDRCQLRGTLPQSDLSETIKIALGMEPRAVHDDCGIVTSSIGNVIGFPGAEAYLAETLPRLGAYFSELSELLTHDD